MSRHNQNPECCNNQTNGQCCHEAILTDEKTPRHVISPQDRQDDQYWLDEVSRKCQMGTLVVGNIVGSKA